VVMCELEVYDLMADVSEKTHRNGCETQINEE